MAKRLSTLVESGKLKLADPALATTSAGSGFFTYQGASIGADTLADRAAITVFAIVSAVAIFYFWKFALRGVRDWHTNLDRAKGLSIVAAGCMVIVGLSSNFNVSALNRGAALDTHQDRFVEVLAGAIEDGYAEIQFLESVAADLRQEITRYKASADEEFEHGTYTGSPGPGAVVNALNGIQARLSTLLGEVTVFTEEAQKLNLEVRDRLEVIRDIANSDAPRKERARKIAIEADAIRPLLTRMNASNLSASMTRTLEALAREVDLHANLSGNSQTAKAQQAALDRVRVEAEQTAANLVVFIGQTVTDLDATALTFQNISATRAVVVYWRDNIPQWAGGLGMDLMPLAFLVFVLVSLTSVDPEHRAIDRVLNTEVRTLVEAGILIDIIHGKARPQDVEHLRERILKLPVERSE
jgi:hypothetical protein